MVSRQWYQLTCLAQHSRATHSRTVFSHRQWLHSTTKGMTQLSFTNGSSYFASPRSYGNELITYEETIDALNGLQSLAVSIQRSRAQPSKLEECVKYLKRTGLSIDDFEKAIPVIHVSGTKGKGSTCALCEGILRAKGFKTGLFTSPHLKCVRERIRINGEPLSPTEFTRYFWEVYGLLYNNKDHELDMPMYFKFLTVMAFNVFLAEKVDVAIIEVGIGGEVDCTNILKKTPIVGITSLGLDHTSILGDTIEKIAWQKAGIIKPGSIALTIPNHCPSALKVLKERAREKGVELITVPDISEYNVDVSSMSFNHQLNSSLAIQLAQSWIKWRDNSSHGQIEKMNTKIDNETMSALRKCRWSGRFEVIRWKNHILYLDGAHTQESASLCAEWFNSTAPKTGKRVLVFNVTHNRQPQKLLKPLVNCRIDIALFCTNILFAEPHKIPNDIANKSLPNKIVNEKVTNDNLDVWTSISGGPSRSFYTVEETMSFVQDIEEQCHVLVTGSLHLVGTVLTLLQQDTRPVEY